MSDTEHSPEWPTPLRGITESVVATRAPDGDWNLAALGLRAGDPVTARTWGRTRTRRNFERTGEGVVQFLTDPVVFVDAAIGILEQEEPVHRTASAWVHVEVRRINEGCRDDTEWINWALIPQDAEVRAREVPTINRGHAAVIEATVAASRLDVPAYDKADLRDRLDRLQVLVNRCGGPQEHAAMRRLASLVDWSPRERDTEDEPENGDATD